MGIVMMGEMDEEGAFQCEYYYYSIGGGVHTGESAESAVLQEVFEEPPLYMALRDGEQRYGVYEKTL